MHSFQPSRGRIVFEVLCALGIVASCVGAWKQTGASALLLAASIAGLYAFVHLFDLARRNPATAEQPQRIDFEPEFQAKVPVAQAVEVPAAAVEPEPAAQLSTEEAEVPERAVPRASAGRRKGGSRKGSGRRAASPKAAKVVALAVPEETEAVESIPVDEVVFEEMADPVLHEEVAHNPVTPLFEPEPYVRMPRQAFGRRGRI
ncbi:MAG TPA: hypothetical protein VFO12_02070, partial [Sphingomicrobium sp.]|nr:hypothetical protein [Sphingomicrobium sp.]